MANWLFSWLKGSQGSRRAHLKGARLRRYVLGVELLEGRAMPSVSFKPAANYGAGDGPRSVAVGDFNGDGKQDLATANDFSDNVSVLLGNGDGTFQAAANYAVGDRPDSVAVGDFNGDGKQDLAAANALSDTVSVLLGNGDGTLQAAVSYGAGNQPDSVAVGDFNDDGKQDLATANAVDNSVSVLLNNGDGTFQAAANFAVGDTPDTLAVGDFNGDRTPDLATTNGNGDSVSVLLNNGDGTFQAAASYAVGDAPGSVAVGDFDGDGKQDLATANGFSDNVSVLLGNGDGTFQAASNYALGNPWSVAVGDFDGDGKQDLAVGNSSVTVSVLLGNGDGTFQDGVNYGAGNLPRSVAVGDFNGDGKQDLATANDFRDNVSVLLNNAAPTDIALSTNSLAENQPVDTVVGSLSSTDPNNGDTFSYSLVSGDGDTDNASFTIDASGNLRTAANLDFEAQSSYSIRVRSTDTGGLSVEKVLTISVSNINETPTDIALSNGSVAENQPVDTVVGTFNTTDPDSGDTVTYSLVSGAGDTDNASFTIDASGNLRTAASLDYEAKSSYSIRVRSTDTTGLFVENVLTISVSNVNETPSDIALSNGSVAENQPVGTVVGSLSTTDPDNGDSFADSLVNGTGDTDNASFTIDASGNLRTAASFDYEAQSSYTIRVRSTDAGGLTVEKVFTIAVTNVNDVTPTVSVPAPQRAFEDVAQRISGIRVADADGGNLTVNLVVSHGRLTLGTTAGLTISGNGTRLVSLSGSIDNLNAALDELKYRGHLNYSGADRLTITATDGDLDATGRVGITVKSAAQQAAALRASVTALRTTSVLGARSALLSYAWLTPSGTPWDIVNTRNFLRTVNMYRQVGILTQAQADSLLVPGNILLLGVSRR